VGLPVVFGKAFGFNVPATVVAGRRLLETSVAVERAAEEELLQSCPVVVGQLAGIDGQVDLVAATIAGVMAVLFD
jgi:hypothetical protein